MGFANLTIAELAEDYDLSVEEILQLCDRLDISYSSPQTALALEDVKAMIAEIDSKGDRSST